MCYQTITVTGLKFYFGRSLRFSNLLGHTVITYLGHTVITSVQTEMFLQCPLFCKSAITIRAMKRTFTLMSTHMTFPRILMQETFRTKFALPRSLAGVPFYVQFKLGRCSEFAAAMIATVRFLAGVDAHMFLQIAILRETL